MNEGASLLGGTLICGVIITSIFVFGIKAGAYTVQKEALERGYMEYNLKTGELDWVKPVGVDL